MDSKQAFEVKVRKTDGTTRVVLLQAYSAIGAQTVVRNESLKSGESVDTAIPLAWAQKPANAAKAPKRTIVNNW
jgi:hypothetical protein